MLMASLTQSNLSVKKTMQLIEILAKTPEPMRLIDLSSQAGMPASTALRMMHTLIQCGYVYQEEKGLQRYGLTMRFMQIGQMAADHFNIRSLVHPYLLELAQAAGESCCVSVEDKLRVRYVDVVENAHGSFVVRQHIGNTASMHNTGSGKVILASYAPEKVDDYIRNKGLPIITEKTRTTREALLEDLERGRETGYFFDDEECEIGIRCVAVPIYDAENQVIAALSISGSVSRMSFNRCHNELIPLLLSYAQRITWQIGGHPSRDDDKPGRSQ